MDIDLSYLQNEYFRDKLRRYLERLFQIDKKIIGLLLFGSIARNEAIYSEKKISDIDLIVIFANGEIPISHRKRSDLKVELMGAALGHIDFLEITIWEVITVKSCRN